MSVQGTVISNLDGLVFSKGYMFATREGGAADAVAFGALQDVDMTHDYAFVELSGPERLPPLAVGLSGESLTGSFTSGVIVPEQLLTLMGGSQVYDAPNTVYTKLVNEEPRPFDLHFESGPTGLEDLDVVLYNCLCNNWNLRGSANRAFMLGAGQFRVYGQSDADGARLWTVTKPGNLTQSS